MTQVTNPWDTLVDGTDQITDIGWFNDVTYAGDPFTSEGIILSTITGINYNVVMHVETATTDTTFGFFVPDNFSVTYEVTSIPEPGAYALFAGALASGMIMLRRRRQRKV